MLVYENFSKLLNIADYYPIIETLGLWKHTTRKTVFCLCVNDFGVKYYSQDNLNHLKQSIEQEYIYKLDITGKNFLGFTLNWNYKKGYIDLSIPNYVKKVLKKL